MLKTLILFPVISVTIFFGIALALIISQPAQKLIPRDGLDFASLQGIEQPNLEQKTYAARDGEKLSYRHIASSNTQAPLAILLHGSGWHGGAYANLAQNIANAADLEIAIPDLRGHGETPSRRGDVNYIGQFEDDIADLIASLNPEGRNVFLIGHSSGGGLVVRFAGGEHASMISKSVLIAPFLGHNAPTTRPNSGGWATPLTRRIIGLSMLNMAKVTLLNHLTAIQFNFPAQVLDGPLGHTATQKYSFRLNASYAPRSDFGADIAALPDFLLISGTQDEAFIAADYESTLSSYSQRGTYQLIEGETHFSILNKPETAQNIAAFLTAEN